MNHAICGLTDNQQSVRKGKNNNNRSKTDWLIDWLIDWFTQFNYTDIQNNTIKSIENQT